jgi:hypothetical protein
MIHVCFKCKTEFLTRFNLTRHVDTCDTELSDLAISNVITDILKDNEKNNKELVIVKNENKDQKQKIKEIEKNNRELAIVKNENKDQKQKIKEIEKDNKELSTLKKENEIQNEKIKEFSKYKTESINFKLLLEKEKEISKNEKRKNKELQEQLEKSQKISNSHVNSHNNTTINSNNVNIVIQVQPIGKMNLDYIKKEYLQEMFDKLNKDQAGNMDLVLKNYIRKILSNEDHPENHAVKYTKKDPPMFSTLVTEDDKETRVVNDLVDTCELISEPLIEQMLKKIKKSWREFRQDPDFDETMDVNLLDDLRSKLKNDNVRRILKKYLKSDILENVEMKIEKSNTKE